VGTTLILPNLKIKISVRLELAFWLLCKFSGLITEGRFHFVWDCTQASYWGHFISLTLVFCK
jgi:hypothetical protein